MKRTIFYMFALLMALPVFAGDKAKQAEITFAEKTFDFGYIKENKGPVSHSFEFINTGEEPLLIISARATCGCTRPEYPKEPILAGQKGVIKVTYVPAGRPGSFDKTITVKTNGKTEHLRIKGTVIPNRE